MKNLILSAFAVLAFGSVASGIRCYTCTFSDPPIPGVGDQSCRGPNPASSHLLDCSGFSSCATVTSTVTAAGVTATSVTRTCGGGSTSSGCINIAGANVCTYVCDTDDCNTTNGSDKVHCNLLVMLVTLFAGVIFIKLSI